MPTIGYLDSRSPEAVAERLRGLRQGLKESGYIENESVVIAYRWAENQPHRLQELAADLVRRGVAAIVTAGPPATFAAKAATTTIPILFLVGDDPVRLGLVASLARPGSNMTGINIFNVELAAKRLELLRELVPRAARSPARQSCRCGDHRDPSERGASGGSRHWAANPGLQRRQRS